MIGKIISHYRITDHLGEGGMGVVYKAHDERLKRDVAIKFLPRHIADRDPDRERFRIEAQAAAALNHPNIATIYSIEEEAGEIFIVMELVDGHELRERTSRGPLPIDDATRVAIQIAEGLQAAHKKEIVHRDIKSSNIMLAGDGSVKIMDFGLAKVGGGAQVTKADSTVGTAAYMSPEQARGEAGGPPQRYVVVRGCAVRNAHRASPVRIPIRTRDHLFHSQRDAEAHIRPPP